MRHILTTNEIWHARRRGLAPNAISRCLERLINEDPTVCEIGLHVAYTKLLNSLPASDSLAKRIIKQAMFVSASLNWRASQNEYPVYIVAGGSSILCGSKRDDITRYYRFLGELERIEIKISYPGLQDFVFAKKMMGVFDKLGFFIRLYVFNYCLMLSCKARSLDMLGNFKEVYSTNFFDRPELKLSRFNTFYEIVSGLSFPDEARYSFNFRRNLIIPRDFLDYFSGYVPNSWVSLVDFPGCPSKYGLVSQLPHRYSRMRDRSCDVLYIEPNSYFYMNINLRLRNRLEIMCGKYGLSMVSRGRFRGSGNLEKFLCDTLANFMPKLVVGLEYTTGPVEAEILGFKVVLLRINNLKNIDLEIDLFENKVISFLGKK